MSLNVIYGSPLKPNFLPQAVFGDDEEQDAKGLSSAEDNSSKAGSGVPMKSGSIGSAEEVDDVNLQPDAATAPSGGSDVGE